jgi:hypothetical protein
MRGVAGEEVAVDLRMSRGVGDGAARGLLAALEWTGKAIPRTSQNQVILLGGVGLGNVRIT